MGKWMQSLQYSDWPNKQMLLPSVGIMGQDLSPPDSATLRRENKKIKVDQTFITINLSQLVNINTIKNISGEVA